MRTQMHREVAHRIRSVLDDQRLVSFSIRSLPSGMGLREKLAANIPEEYVAMLAGQTRGV